MPCVKYYGERVVDTISQKITYQALFCQYTLIETDLECVYHPTFNCYFTTIPYKNSLKLVAK